MKTKIFNPTLPTVLAPRFRIRPPFLHELNHIKCFKYADINYAFEQSDNYVRAILSSIPIFNKHKRVLIDIKLHNLTKGETPCTPGWHLDGSICPKGQTKTPERFTLFVTGESCLTEFLADPFEHEVREQDTFMDFVRLGKKIKKDHRIYTIPSCTFVSYDDTYFHRGAIAKDKEARLLIRTTETDIIPAQNKIYTPYTYNPNYDK